MKVLEKYLLLALLLLLPTQLAFHFWPSWSFVYGLRVDLLAPALYLTDIIIVVIFILNLKVINEKRIHFLALFTLACLNVLFSVSQGVSVYRWLKVFEFLFLAFYIAKQQYFTSNEIVKYLFISAVFFSAVGILQFINGETLGGVLYYFGERTFNTVTPGIALTNLGGASYLRAYSVFSHPNSLAGYLGAVLIFFVLMQKYKKTWQDYLALTVVIACLMLTFSASASLGLLFTAFMYYFFSKSPHQLLYLRSFLLLTILTSLILPLVPGSLTGFFSPTKPNISERFDLAYISGNIISDHFLTGSGLGTFITNIPDYKGIFTFSWLLQPVHNIFLLALSETGVIGLLVVVFLLNKLLHQKLTSAFFTVFVFIIFTGMFDHYWFTLQQNILLFSVLVGLTSLRRTNSGIQ